MSKRKEDNGLKISRESFKAEPTFRITRSPQTAVVGADFVKYMVDPDCGMGTLIFYRKYPVPKRDSKGWSVDRMEEESFLEVKVPLNTLFACAIGLYQVAQEMSKSKKKTITYFGPSKVIQKEKPNDMG
jgi:hypothetical protein